MLPDQIAAEVEAGRFRRAIQLCNVALNRRPARELDCRLRLERAAALTSVGEWSAAELDCRRALEHGPDARAHALLARALLEQKRSREAAAQAEAAIALDPSRADAWQVYAQALSAEKRHGAAVHAAREAHRSESESSRSAVLTLLRVLAAAGRHEEAVAVAEHELKNGPGDAELWAILGMSSGALGQSDAAIAAYQRALALEPERVDAACGLGFLLLRRGQLAEGFRLNEHRQPKAGAHRRLGVPPWNGEPLAGRHLLVWSEQGLGDIIQFARFMQCARASAKRTTLIVPSALLSLLRSNPELGEIHAQHPGFGAADYQCLVMSLPHHLKAGTPSAIARVAVPYVFPEPARVERWRARLPRDPKIALAWQGNPSYAGDPWRSMPFSHFAPLLERYSNRVSFLSLQKNLGREQLASSPHARKVLDLSHDIDREGQAFVDSLAILSLVDCLITTDSAIAHVAGAAGIRTWLLLGEAADWRWGLEGETTPWYPSLRLFRQTGPGDWAGVIQRVAAELGDH